MRDEKVRVMVRGIEEHLQKRAPKQCLRLWIGLIWLRIGTSGGLSPTRQLHVQYFDYCTAVALHQVLGLFH